MIKNFGFQVAVLLLVAHGVTVGMMKVTKVLPMVPKFNRSAYLMSGNNRTYELEMAKIKAKCTVLAADLSGNDEWYMLGQVDSMVEKNNEGTYDLEIAKIKAKCIVLAADLPGGDEWYMLGQVERMVQK